MSFEKITFAFSDESPLQWGYFANFAHTMVISKKNRHCQMLRLSERVKASLHTKRAQERLGRYSFTSPVFTGKPKRKQTTEYKRSAYKYISGPLSRTGVSYLFIKSSIAFSRITSLSLFLSSREICTSTSGSIPFSICCFCTSRRTLLGNINAQPFGR